MALVGGGGKAFIGRVHATAATLDQRAELVAGVLSSDPERGRAAAPSFSISAERAYGSIDQLIDGEAAMDVAQRIDFVSIATPNFTHFPIARAALQAGYDVICDKPMTINVAEAEQLAQLVRERGAVFAVTHNYSGYPLVRQAHEMIRQGELGEIQAVRVEYIQGWMRSLKPGAQLERGLWKADPEKAGSGALGDIGTHAYHLLRYTTRLTPTAILSLLRTWTPERKLDDYGHALLRFSSFRSRQKCSASRSKTQLSRLAFRKPAMLAVA
jgi:predicted dehydrogenase